MLDIEIKYSVDYRKIERHCIASLSCPECPIFETEGSSGVTRYESELELSDVNWEKLDKQVVQVLGKARKRLDHLVKLTNEKPKDEVLDLSDKEIEG